MSVAHDTTTRCPRAAPSFCSSQTGPYAICGAGNFLPNTPVTIPDQASAQWAVKGCMWEHPRKNRPTLQILWSWISIPPHAGVFFLRCCGRDWVAAVPVSRTTKVGQLDMGIGFGRHLYPPQVGAVDRGVWIHTSAAEVGREHAVGLAHDAVPVVEPACVNLQVGRLRTSRTRRKRSNECHQDSRNIYAACMHFTSGGDHKPLAVALRYSCTLPAAGGVAIGGLGGGLYILNVTTNPSWLQFRS